MFSYGTEDDLLIGNPLGSCSSRTFARKSLQGLFLNVHDIVQKYNLMFSALFCGCFFFHCSIIMYISLTKSMYMYSVVRDAVVIN